MVALANEDDEAWLAAEVGANVARWRQMRGWSQRELARRMGCDHSAVSLWEGGKRLPSLGHLFALGRVLDCSVPSLLPTDDE